MFKVGDKIVYDGKCEYYTSLKKFSTYTIDDIFNDDNDHGQLFTVFEMPEGCIYFSEFFIKLKEHRKLKINQLESCSKKEKK